MFATCLIAGSLIYLITELARRQCSTAATSDRGLQRELDRYYASK